MKKLMLLTLIALSLYGDSFKDVFAEYNKGNLVKAVELYKKSCDGGYARGCGVLGLMYANGEGVKQDAYKAVELYKKSCDGGFAMGCFSLGFMYANGYGIKQDNLKAVELYKKACDSSEAIGCYNLGLMYHNGQIGRAHV